ncbi:MarR family transcriptional regulator [bacterium]|nr:MarR family transcriptional regulator [bacterium]
MSTHYQGSPKEVSALNAWIKLARAKDTIIQNIRPIIEKHGLTISQFGTMECIFHLGPQSQKQIGKKLLVSGANIVKVVDNLERDKLVKRIAHPSDRRSNLVQLTPAGESKIKIVFDEHLQVLTTVFDALSEREAKSLGDLCKKLGLGQS